MAQHIHTLHDAREFVTTHQSTTSRRLGIYKVAWLLYEYHPVAVQQFKKHKKTSVVESKCPETFDLQTLHTTGLSLTEVEAVLHRIMHPDVTSSYDIHLTLWLAWPPEVASFTKQ